MVCVPVYPESSALWSVSLYTLSAVGHAALCGLKQVDVEGPAVAHGDGDAEQAAVRGPAGQGWPGGTGRQLGQPQGARQ